MTKRKIWAIKRNWLIKRLLGALSVFSDENIKLMSEYLPQNTIYETTGNLKYIIEVMRSSKYKE